MNWKVTTVGTMLVLALGSAGSAQTPHGNSAGAPSEGAKGNNPPGTPSWGSKRMPDRKNPTSPTAPCPAGTTRQNLGQDCKPLDQPEKQKPPKRE